MAGLGDGKRLAGVGLAVEEECAYSCTLCRYLGLCRDAWQLAHHEKERPTERREMNGSEAPSRCCSGAAANLARKSLE